MTLVNGIAFGIVAVILIGALLWWLFIATEGVYLGRGIVIWLYDVYARRYDGIKKYDEDWEAETLAEPILEELYNVPTPLILDVATGTARLPLTLFGQSDFEGTIIGLDYSRRMLSAAAVKLAPLDQHRALIYQPAQALPFTDNTFDAVTCLEALEFMPDPGAVIAELVRVTRPGGLILITNRKGFDARLMPGKTQSNEVIVAELSSRFTLNNVRAQAWQMDYALIWAFKPGKRKPARAHTVELVLRCPTCGQHLLKRGVNALDCEACGAQIPVDTDGVIDYVHARAGKSVNVSD